MLHISYCCISDTVTVEIFWITGENLFLKSQVRIFSLNQDWKPFFEWWRNFLNLKWKSISWIMNKNLWLGYQLEKKACSKKFLSLKSVQIRSFFWSVFSHIRTEYGKILRISSYSVQIRVNMDQKVLRIWTLFTQYLSAFSPNAGKYKKEKTPYLNAFHTVFIKLFQLYDSFLVKK